MTKIVKSDQLIKMLKDRKEFSPDVHELGMRQTHLVLVTGRLKHNDMRHSMYFSNAKFLGGGVTLEPKFILKVAPKEFPVVLERPKDSQAALRVKGEVYAVDLTTLLRLDLFESNQGLTRREQVWVQLLDQIAPTKDTSTTRNPVVSCWLYVGIPDVWTTDNQSQMVFVNRVPFRDNYFAWEYKDKSNFSIAC